MKKTICLILTVAVLFAFAACTPAPVIVAPTPAPIVTPAPIPEPTEEPTVEPTAEPTVAPTPPMDNQVSGTYIDSTEHIIAIEGQNETLLSFYIDEHTAIVGATQLTLGDNVVIDYSGDLNTSPIADTVKFINAGNPGDLSQVTGVVGYYKPDKGQFALICATGHTYVLRIDNKTLLNGNGIANELAGDETVKVTYSGKLMTDSYAIAIDILKSADENKTDPYISGTVVKFNKNETSVKTSSGHTYIIFMRGDTRIGGKDTELHLGDTVKIRYKGDLNVEAQAIEIQITKLHVDPNQIRSYNGTIDILPGAGRHFTLTTDKGNTYNFTFTDSTVGMDSVAPGDYVRVTYTGIMTSGTAVAKKVVRWYTN